MAICNYCVNSYRQISPLIQSVAAKGNRCERETLRAMLEVGAVRELLVSRHGDKWGLAIRLGGAGSRWLPVRSWREALRTWAS
jgi:hypothetical protein